MAQYIIAHHDYRRNTLQKLPLSDNNNCKDSRQRNLKNFKLPQDFPSVPSPNSSLHPNSSLITPFFKLFHWTLLAEYSIEYDEERGGFWCKKGRIFVKALCYIWLVLLVIYLSLICFNDVNEHHTLKAVVGKITWICYTLFDIAVIKCLWLNGNKIAKLLNEGNQISNLCDKIANNGNLQRPLQLKKREKYVKYIALTVCLLAVVYTILFVLYVIIELTAITTNIYSVFMNVTSSDGHNDGKVEWKNGHDLRQNLLERYTASPVAAILLTIWLLMAFSVELIWVIFLLMITSAGYYFKRLLKSCIENIETKNVETFEGIRTFTKVTLLLEDFNKLFGTTLLWIVLASVMYTSSTLGEYLAGFSNEFIYDLLNIIGFLPFLSAVYAGSELHRMGQVLPSIIKRQFLHLDVTDQIQMFQVMHGTSVVQYDALSNNIGLKGHFFVFSYTFVTSLVGVIITYSVLVIQFKLGEIPLD